MKLEEIQKTWSSPFHSELMSNSILEELGFAQIYMPKLLAVAKAAKLCLEQVRYDEHETSTDTDLKEALAQLEE